MVTLEPTSTVTSSMAVPPSVSKLTVALVDFHIAYSVMSSVTAVEKSYSRAIILFVLQQSKR